MSIAREKANYLRQDSDQLLCDALAEFRNLSGPFQMQELAVRREFSQDPVLNEAALAIDLAFVIFGCEKNYLGSLRLIYWIIFASSGGWALGAKVYKGYFQHYDSNKRTRWQGLRLYLARAPNLWMTFFKSLYVRKRWQIYGYHKDLQRPLSKLRREYRIHI